jgi:20S proteasome subunit alpha 5
LGVEQRVQSPLLESSSIEKIMEIDRHLGCAMSGLTADARTMIDHARVTSQNHAFTYDEKIKVESVTQAVCDLALRFGESVHDEDAMMSRPFGVALLIAGVDEKGPQLYVIPPTICTWPSGLTQLRPKIPHRPIGDIYEVRSKGHRLRFRGRTIRVAG